MDQFNLDNIIVALLFASDEPLSTKRMSAVMDDLDAPAIRESLERIEANFRGEDSPIRLEQVAGGYQLATSREFSEYVARLYRGRRKQRLSKAAMETLAIIAYKQPVTRADVENIRGVGCGGVITTLMERSLIRIVGKAKVLGSPFLYGTAQEFLEYLGLNSLKDLPSLEDLEALLEEEAASESTEGDNGETAVPDGKQPEKEKPDIDQTESAEMVLDTNEANVDVDEPNEPAQSVPPAPARDDISDELTENVYSDEKDPERK